MNAPFQGHIVVKNLTHDVTPETLSEYLWTALGLNVPADAIRMASPGTLSSMAFVHISKECIAEFLRRYMDGLTFNGRTLGIEAAGEARRNLGGKHHPAMPTVTRPKVLAQK